MMNLTLLGRSIPLVKKVFCFALLVASGGFRAFAEEGAIIFTYDSNTGLVTWARDMAHPAEHVVVLIIDGPKPLGFPRNSPRWQTVVYLDDHAEFYAFNPASIPLIAGNHPDPSGTAQPLLVYSSGLTAHDFGTITYATTDLIVPCVTPSG